ncbi:MAG: hypothetical protein WBQ86_08930 [Candidatus Binatus sp.]
MASWKTESEGASIVLIGKFNPAIFQPAWLGAGNLIRREEADAAKIELVNPQLTSFSADWLKVQVLSERFLATTVDTEHYQALRDLVISIFQLLEHTPFWTMGMNRDMHFKMKSEEEWHRLGHLLAPKEIWRPLMDQPGLRSLLIQSSPSKHNEIQIVRNVRVEPSTQVMPGVYIQFNIELSLPGGAQAGIITQQRAARELTKQLSESWTDMLVEAQKIADHILSKV